MSQHSRDILESVSHYCYVKKSPYLYAKSPSDGTHRYRGYDRGQLQIYTWVDELCLYYLRQEARIYQEFLASLQSHRTHIQEQLRPSSYRDGLLTALDDILKYIDEKR